MDTELDDGRTMKLTAGMTYFVGDDCEAHRSSTQTAANFTLWIKQKNIFCSITYTSNYPFIAKIYVQELYYIYRYKSPTT